MRLELGQAVGCGDGPVGPLADFVVDPGHRHLTHLVVQPEGTRRGARLVPLPQVAAATGNGIALRCGRAEVDAMPAVAEVAFRGAYDRPAGDPEWDVGASDMTALPAYEPLGGIGPVDVGPDPQVMVAYDRIPKGDVELRGCSPVTAADGHRVGQLDGLVVDEQGVMAELILVRGHLWGRREVRVPIAAVERLGNDTVELGLTKRELGELAGRGRRRTS